MLHDEYSGTRIDFSEADAERIDEDDLSEGFLRWLETTGEEKTLSVMEKKRLEAYFQEKTRPAKSSVGGNIVGALVILVIIGVPLVITYMQQRVMLGILWACLVAAIAVFSVILDKRNRRTYGKKQDAVKEGNYKVYNLAIEEKLWCRYRTGSRRNRRTVDAFFFRFDGLTLCASETVYEEISENVIAVVVFLEKATLDFVAPAKLFGGQ